MHHTLKYVRLFVNVPLRQHINILLYLSRCSRVHAPISPIRVLGILRVESVIAVQYSLKGFHERVPFKGEPLHVRTEVIQLKGPRLEMVACHTYVLS